MCNENRKAEMKIERDGIRYDPFNAYGCNKWNIEISVHLSGVSDDDLRQVQRSFNEFLGVVEKKSDAD